MQYSPLTGLSFKQILQVHYFRSLHIALENGKSVCRAIRAGVLRKDRQESVSVVSPVEPDIVFFDAVFVTAIE